MHSAYEIYATCKQGLNFNVIDIRIHSLNTNFHEIAFIYNHSTQLHLLKENPLTFLDHEELDFRFGFGVLLLLPVYYITCINNCTIEASGKIALSRYSSGVAIDFSVPA